MCPLDKIKIGYSITPQGRCKGHREFLEIGKSFPQLDTVDIVDYVQESHARTGIGGSLLKEENDVS